jgi:hypothetical protein
MAHRIGLNTGISHSGSSDAVGWSETDYDETNTHFETRPKDEPQSRRPARRFAFAKSN